MTQAGTIKILHIASGDLWAGAEVQLLTLATALQKKPDVDVHVILFNSGKLWRRLHDAGIAVSIYDESRLNGFQLLYRLARKLRELKPDVVHTHRTKENILGSIAALMTGNIPSIRTSHGAAEHLPPWYHIPKRMILLLDWFSGRYLQDKVIAVSKDLAGILRKHFPADRIIVIQNGIDLSSLPDLNKQSTSDRDHPTRPYRFGIAGRLVPVKRVDIYIRTAAELRSVYPDINATFHIYGEGPLRSQLEALSGELNASGTIRFEGQCEDMHAALAAMDALIITSDHEGLPMIVLEAMALRTPVIAHAVGGIPELLDEGNCGALVTENAPSAFAEAIHQLISDPAYRDNLTENAQERVAARYNHEANANAYHRVYQDLLK